MKKVLGYVIAFMAGTTLSGTAAFAATNYVQALKGSSIVTLNGSTVVAAPPKLVYGGTTYVQLYSIQQGLKKAGIQNTWNGSVFDMTIPQTSTPPTTGQGTGEGGTTTTQPTTSPRDPDAVVADLTASYSSLTINGTTVHFTYYHGVDVGTGCGIIGHLDDSDYLNWLNLLINNWSDVNQSLTPFAQGVNSLTTKHGYSSIFLDMIYQGTSSTYPSGYDPSEISVTSNGDFLITHSIFVVSGPTAELH